MTFQYDKSLKVYTTKFNLKNNENEKKKEKETLETLILNNNKIIKHLESRLKVAGS